MSSDKQNGYGLRSVFVVIIFLCGCVFSSCNDSVGPNSNSSESENVVIIVVDTLRADRIFGERNGIPIMPKIAALARDSWVFTNATSQASWTKPAIASLYTSLYPSTHNVNFGLDSVASNGLDMLNDVFPEDLRTMAEYFSDAGYNTIGLQTNAMLKDPSFARGFDTYEFHEYPGFSARSMTDLALNKIARAEANDSFFMYLQYLDPHAPYDPPKKYQGIFGELPPISDQDRDILSHYTDYYMDKVRNDIGLQEKRHRETLSQFAKEYIRIMYDGEARYIDDEVARLIENIRKNHPDTIFVIVADHGEEFWEHGSVGHGKTLYEELINVPLIFSFPDADPRSVSQRVEVIDVLPTLADRLGLGASAHWQGRSLLFSNDENSDNNRSVYSETRTSQKDVNIYLGSVISGNDKIIIDTVTNEVEFFDLDKDPFEQNDLSTNRKSRLTDLVTLWEEFLINGQSSAAYHEYRTTNILDEETLEQLRSIGYLDTEPDE